MSRLCLITVCTWVANRSSQRRKQSGLKYPARHWNATKKGERESDAAAVAVTAAKIPCSVPLSENSPKKVARTEPMGSEISRLGTQLTVHEPNIKGLFGNARQ